MHPSVASTLTKKHAAASVVRSQLRVDPSTQLIGRSRAERLLDGFYNRQSRELRKRQHQKLKEAHARRLAAKKRALAESQAAQRAAKRQRVEPVKQRSPMQALHLLVDCFSKEAKFAKAVSMFHKLAQEYLTADNREHFVYGCWVLAHSDLCSSVPDARQEIVSMFEKCFFPKLHPAFRSRLVRHDTQPDEPGMFDYLESELLAVLQVEAVMHNRMLTDDSYVFNGVVEKLTQLVDELKTYDEWQRMPEADDEEEEGGEDDDHRNAAEEFMDDMDTSDESGEGSPREGVASPSRDDDDAVCAPEDSAAEDDVVGGEGTAGQVVVSGATESECEGATHQQLQRKFDEAENDAPAEATTVKEEEKQEGDEAGDTQDEGVPQNGTRLPPIVKLENVKSEEEEEEKKVDLMADPPIPWTFPSRKLLHATRRHFVFKCLGTAFHYRHTLWARTAVEGLFHKVYLKSDLLFSLEEKDQIAKWQSQVKAARTNDHHFQKVHVLGIGEAKNPVRDGREERINTIHGSAIWSAKQTGL